MPYLIDGYNLLHALGVLTGRTGPHGLEKARLRLLGMLHGAFPDARPAEVVVVFDAAHAPPGAAAEQDYHGIRVIFAVRRPHADDLIEDLIRQEASPRHLQVVSDDHQIQQAARHRHCVALGCLDFMKMIERRPSAPDRRDPAEASRTVSSQEEIQRWLELFADIEQDPELGQPHYPYDLPKDD